MRTAKHTPGPWTTDWGFILAARADGRDNYIAETVKSDEEGLYIEDAAEREANSHLLAAAPEMAQRLRDIVHAYESGSASALQVWIEDTRALLAKAGVQS
jgi:hypothetical protein